MDGMNAQDLKNILMGMFENTPEHKNAAMVDIMLNRQAYEQNLNEMWRIYTSGNMRQVFEYRKQVEKIKAAGLVVLRNKAGNHKIVYKKEA